jgi:hypothetical protein
MHPDLLRALVIGFAIVGPVWVVAPLLRRGRRMWPVVIAVALVYAALSNEYFSAEYDMVGSLIRAIAMTTLVVLFGRFMAQSQLRKAEQDKRDLDAKDKKSGK